MFDDLVGNNDIKAILRRLIAAARVPNSLIFSGIDGVGKRQFAIELAKSLICKTPVRGEACNECSSCKRVDVIEFPKPDDRDGHRRLILSEHPDFGIVIPYNRNILIDAIRSLESEAQFRPFEARLRAFIIDDADKMNESASNALLKTLEEPASTSHIFLITSRVDSLLPTIRSRCQVLRFEPVETSLIEDFLRHSNKFLPEDTSLVARTANGSIGRAIRTDVEKFKQTRDRMLEVVEHALVRNDKAELLRIAESMNDAKHKADYEEQINVLKVLLHDVFLLRSGRRMEIVNNDVLPRLDEAAKATGSEVLIRSIEEIETLQSNLAVNINRKVATDGLFVTIGGHR
jgi:DNA polymerase-3 subunit delta'